MTIADYVDCNIKNDPCFINDCPGHYEQTFYAGTSFSFKGGSPTPKFHRKANQG